MPRYSPATELAYLKSRLCGASITKDGVLEDRSSDNAFQGFFRTCANKFMFVKAAPPWREATTPTVNNTSRPRIWRIPKL